MLELLTRESAQTLERRDAIPQPRTFDQANNSIEAVIATNAPVRRQDARGSFLEILDPAGLDLAGSRGSSVLNSHQQGDVEAILGTLGEVRIEDDAVVGVIRLSSRPEVAPIIADIRSGVIAHLSVGYEVGQWRDSEGNGLRTRTAVQWVIREVSFVPVPADRNARTRSLPTTSGRAGINRAIRELCSRAGIEQIIVDDLIDNERSIEDARGIVLDQLVTRGRTPIMTAHNTQTLDRPENFIRAAGEALHNRVSPSSQVSGPARQYVGMTIPDLARECLRRSGESVMALSAPELVTRALHTTSDFPLILADTVGRELRASYTAAPSGLRQLCRQTTVPDFRERSSLMLDSTGLLLEKVREHGEFKHGSFVETGERYKAETFGKIFAISRKAIINDDLGAFSDVSRRLGTAAAAFENQQLVDLLISNAGVGPTMSDTKAFFHTDHNNLAGSGAAPSETTLSAARLAMRRQTAPGGGPIDATPWALLAPPDMETAVEKLLTTIRPVTVDDANPFSTLRLIIEARFTSPTAWYVIANPTTIDGLIFCYLAGSPGPQIESRAGFEIDGVEVRVRLDFGCAAIDWRGWYRNAGQ